jgi:hypothetical protein
MLALPQDNTHLLIDFPAMILEVPSHTRIVALAVSRAHPNEHADRDPPISSRSLRETNRRQ